MLALCPLSALSVSKVGEGVRWGLTRRDPKPQEAENKGLFRVWGLGFRV